MDTASEIRALREKLSDKEISFFDLDDIYSAGPWLHFIPVIKRRFEKGEKFSSSILRRKLGIGKKKVAIILREFEKAGVIQRMPNIGWSSTHWHTLRPEFYEHYKLDTEINFDPNDPEEILWRIQAGLDVNI